MGESNFSRHTLGFAGIYGSTAFPPLPFLLVKPNQLAFFPPRNPLVLDYARRFILPPTQLGSRHSKRVSFRALSFRTQFLSPVFLQPSFLCVLFIEIMWVLFHICFIGRAALLTERLFSLLLERLFWILALDWQIFSNLYSQQHIGMKIGFGQWALPELLYFQCNDFS